MNKIFGLITKNNISDINFNKNIYKDKNIILSSYNYLLNTNNIEPFVKYDCQNKYIIIYNGFLTNKKDLKCKLRTLGYQFKTDLDEEIILNAYIYHKENSFNLLKGSFSFAIYGNNKIIIVRDKIGAKSMFYTINESYFAFSNEIKHLLKSNVVEPIVDETGLKELFAIGPGFSNEITPFKDIKRLLPGQYIEYENGNISKVTYYKLPIFPYLKNYEYAKKEVKRILNDSIHNFIDDKNDYCSLLSGGLDSSIISKISSTNERINTYFLEYKNNDIYFKSNDYQMDLDKYYSLIMNKNINSNFNDLIINEEELFNNLIDSLIARDLPGMGDIDSSMYWLFTKINQKYILNGEGADELFGGYPWFYNELENSYPWIRNIDEKQTLLNDNYQFINLKEYTSNSYDKLLNNYDELIYDDEINKKWRKLKYLNIYGFLQQLLYRLESISNSTDKISYSPFLDIELIEFIYNLPKEYINHNNDKKGILKEIYKDILPIEIINRQKNPYPKTYSPLYKKMVSDKIKTYLNDPESSINRFFNKCKIIELIEKENNIPFYGQLMTNIQYLSYLIQFEEWVKIYKVKFVI